MARASISVRVSESVPERLDALAPRIAPPGADFGRSDAARAALEKGLAVLEAEHGLGADAVPTSTKAKARRSARR